MGSTTSAAAARISASTISSRLRTLRTNRCRRVRAASRMAAVTARPDASTGSRRHRPPSSRFNSKAAWVAMPCPVPAARACASNSSPNAAAASPTSSAPPRYMETAPSNDVRANVRTPAAGLANAPRLRRSRSTPISKPMPSAMANGSGVCVSMMSRQYGEDGVAARSLIVAPKRPRRESAIRPIRARRPISTPVDSRQHRRCRALLT